MSTVKAILVELDPSVLTAKPMKDNAITLGKGKDSSSEDSKNKKQK